MTLDLDELIGGWDCPAGEVRARLVVGRDGNELVQLRIDLGVMQMLPAGRPDGHLSHGMPSTRDYVEHELRVESAELTSADWQELARELSQTNYRRLAFATLAETALQDNDQRAARRFLADALRDIDACLLDLDLLDSAGKPVDEDESLQPTLVFDRARLLSQLRVVEGQFEAAIEEAESGAAALDTLLTELGYDEEQRAQDPGTVFLKNLGGRLRREYGITTTLREQLAAAIENEDFERAAELRDALDSRQNPSSCERPQAPHDGDCGRATR